MRASLVTDVAQSVTCVGFLIGLVIVLGVNAPASFGSWNPVGMHFHTPLPNLFRGTDAGLLICFARDIVVFT